MSKPVQYKEVNLATATPVSVTTKPSELISIRPSVVMSAHTVAVQDGPAVSAVAEVATMTGTGGLTAGQTFTVAGLTFTSTGVTTLPQLLTAFASLSDGATTGGGTGEGAYSGTLTGYATGAVSNNTVTFTATASEAATDLVISGTGAANATLAVTTQGVDAVAEVATMTGVAGLGASEAYTVAGLTFTDDGTGCSQGELLTAFASLADGATTGGGSGYGTYSGTLTGYATSAVSDNVVTFTATAAEAASDLTASGTGAASATIAVTVQGVDAVAEVAVITGAGGLSAGETYTVAGLTYTSTGVTTEAELLAAFASLSDTDTTGAGTGTGAYSGALTGYDTSAVSGNVVTFTSVVSAAVDDISASGTGADAAAIAVTVEGVTVDGTLVGTLTASSAVTARFDFDGITLHRGIELVPNASSTGKVIVAYRLV